MTFHALGLSPAILESLEAMKFTTPTPIQEQTIPPALKGLDVLGSAQTGTGKTGAYGIPTVSYLLNSPLHSALILVPTRELAAQVYDTARQILGKKTDVQTSLLIGGEPILKQFKQLRNRPRLIVGTPGRVNDHLSRGSLNLDTTGFLVLDETDRMLDMGFSVQLERIAKYLPRKPQTLMFSATMAPGVSRIAENYLKDPVRIAIGSKTAPAAKIKQEVLRTSESEKYGIVLNQLNESNGSFLIFVKTKSGAERLADKLCGSGHKADAIHGDLRQRCRERTIADFRSLKNRVLVATDIAARGLDISHIECVLNYDLPQCPEDYIHRIGRTGRAGAEGKAISLVTSEDSVKWRNICRLIDPENASRRSEGERQPNRRSFSGNRRFKRSAA